MPNRGVSFPLRVLCAIAALLCGYVAVIIGVTGELRVKGTVTELSPFFRCLNLGVLALLSGVAGWVAVTGRE